MTRSKMAVTETLMAVLETLRPRPRPRRRAPRASRRGVRMALVAAAALFTAACSTSDLLDVEPPDIIDPDDVQSPSGANALRAGALARFTQATSGSESLFLLGGLFADEWINGDTFIDRQRFDRREMNADNSFLTTAARNTSRATLSAEQAVESMAQWIPDAPGWQVAEMHFVQAYLVNLSAEHFCNGLVFSSIVDGALQYGTPMTTAAAFERALGHAEDGLALITESSADATRVASALRVTRGRILMNLDRPADAAAAVGDVSTDFQYANLHSESTFSNAPWNWNLLTRRYSVSDNEGGNGLDFASAHDPRLPTCEAPCPDVGVERGEVDDTSVPLLVQLLWTTRESPVTTVGGIEARMIEAEAYLRAGDPAAALATLNAARATVPGLEPLADAGGEAARIDQLFREKAFWLYGRGHRFGDLRRLVRQYGRPADDVFPTGAWHKAGATYGSDVTIPIPFAETNNPNVSPNAICMDRNA